MPTNLQRNLAREIISNSKRKKPLNKKQLVVSSGYGEVTADRHASEVIEQVGVLEALNDFGFSVDNAKKVVGNILNDERVKPETRIRASEQVFKVHGTYAPDKSININIEADASNEVKELTEKLNALQRGASLPSNGTSTDTLDNQAQDKE